MEKTANEMIDQIRVWARIPLEDRGSLPDSPGLYACWSGDNVLYVGQSATSIFRRWQNHEKLSLIGSVHDPHISYCEMPVNGDEVLHRQRILEQEILLIRALKPPFNRSGIPTVKRKKFKKSVSESPRFATATPDGKAQSLAILSWVDLSKRVSQLRLAAKDLLTLAELVDREVDERIKEITSGEVTHNGRITIDPSSVLSLSEKALETAAVAFRLWGRNKILEGESERFFFAVKESTKAILRHEMRDAVMRFDIAMSDSELDCLATVAAINIDSEVESMCDLSVAVLNQYSDDRAKAYQEFMKVVEKSFGV